MALERVSDLFKGVVNSTVYTSTKEVTINDEEVELRDDEDDDVPSADALNIASKKEETNEVTSEN